MGRKLISERVKPLISVLKTFESNLGFTSLTQDLIDCVKFHLDSQLKFYEDSVSGIIERKFHNWRKRAIQGTCNAVFSESQCDVWKVF